MQRNFSLDWFFCLAHLVFRPKNGVKRQRNTRSEGFKFSHSLTPEQSLKDAIQPKQFWGDNLISWREGVFLISKVESTQSPPPTRPHAHPHPHIRPPPPPTTSPPHPQSTLLYLAVWNPLSSPALPVLPSPNRLTPPPQLRSPTPPKASITVRWPPARCYRSQPLACSLRAIRPT